MLRTAIVVMICLAHLAAVAGLARFAEWCARIPRPASRVGAICRSAISGLFAGCFIATVGVWVYSKGLYLGLFVILPSFLLAAAFPGELSGDHPALSAVAAVAYAGGALEGLMYGVIGGLLGAVTPPAGRCRNCGYDLTGNASGICPECGTAIPPSRPTPPRQWLFPADRDEFPRKRRSRH